MAESKEARNKALVLKAFDTLFNKRDYVAAERYWSPNYIQHSAHIEPGRDGLFNLIRNAPPHPALRTSARSRALRRGEAGLPARPVQGSVRAVFETESQRQDRVQVWRPLIKEVAQQ